ECGRSGVSAAKNIVSTRTIAPTSRRSRRTSANKAAYFLPFPFPPRVSGTKIPGGGGGGAGGGLFGAAISVQCTAEFERPEDGFDHQSKAGCREKDKQPIGRCQTRQLGARRSRNARRPSCPSAPALR